MHHPDFWPDGGAMPQSRGYLSAVVFILQAAIIGCHTADQDLADHRRSLAQRACEDAVRGQLTSRATAQFFADSEHVYYDSLGGAGVTGAVTTTSGPHNFACVLKPATDSTWTLTAARLMN